MASYSPLQMHVLEHQPEDSEDFIQLPSKKANSEYRTTDSLSKWPAWAALAHSLLAIICACTLYIINSACVSERRDAPGLRQPNQFPGLELVDDLQQQQKGAWIQ